LSVQYFFISFIPARNPSSRERSGDLTRLSSPQSLLLDLTSRHRDQVDAVPASFFVGQIVSQMRPGQTHSFAIGQDANILPIDLLVAKGWPAVTLAFDSKVIPSAAFRSGEQEFARIAVKELHRLIVLFQLGNFSQEFAGVLPVSGILGVVSG